VEQLLQVVLFQKWHRNLPIHTAKRKHKTPIIILILISGMHIIELNVCIVIYKWKESKELEPKGRKFTTQLYKDLNKWIMIQQPISIVIFIPDDMINNWGATPWLGCLQGMLFWAYANQFQNNRALKNSCTWEHATGFYTCTLDTSVVYKYFDQNPVSKHSDLPRSSFLLYLQNYSNLWCYSLTKLLLAFSC
jgi:hypothetical protein